MRFADAAVMMGKAIELLKDDSDYVRSLQPKWWFLQAKSYLDELNTSITYEEAISITQHAIEKSPGAAYCYTLLGQLYRSSKRPQQQDSVSVLYNKAIAYYSCALKLNPSDHRCTTTLVWPCMIKRKWRKRKYSTGHRWPLSRIM